MQFVGGCFDVLDDFFGFGDWCFEGYGQICFDLILGNGWKELKDYVIVGDDFESEDQRGEGQSDGEIVLVQCVFEQWFVDLFGEMFECLYWFVLELLVGWFGFIVG